MTTPPVNPKTNPDSLSPSRYWKTYTSFVADIDLVSDGGDLCRLIVINAAGSGAISLRGIKDAAAGTTFDDTQTGRQQGDEIKVQASKILASGTSITSCTVYW